MKPTGAGVVTSPSRVGPGHLVGMAHLAERSDQILDATGTVHDPDQLTLFDWPPAKVVIPHPAHVARVSAALAAQTR